MAVLGDVLMAPSLPAREVERLKAERLAELLQLRAEPRGLADETLGRVVSAAAARYHPGVVTLIVAGDVETGAVERLAEATLGKWRGVARGEIATPDRAATDGRRGELCANAGRPPS